MQLDSHYGTRPSLGWAPHLMLCLAAAALGVSALRGTAAYYESILLFGELVLLSGLALFWISRKLQVGMAIMVLCCLFVPLQLETGSQTGLNVPFLLAPAVITVWLLRMLIQKQSLFQSSSRTVRPLILFLLVSVASTVAAQFLQFEMPEAPIRAQIGGLAILLFSGGIFLMSTSVFRDVRWLKRITLLFLVAGALRVSLALIEGPQDQPTSLFSDIGPLGSMFWTWLTALAISQALTNRQLSIGWRLAAAGLVIMILYLTIAQWHEWASGWLPSGVAILVVIALSTRKLFVTIMVSGAAIAIWNLEGIIRFFWTPDQIISYTTRLAMAQTLLETVKRNVLLGSGPANYNHYLHLNSHNNYLDILVQTGILGLFCFLWFLFELGVVCLRLRRQVPEGFPSAYVCGVTAGLAGTLCAAALGDWLLPFVYNIGVSGFRASIFAWIFLGGLVACERSMRGVRSRGMAKP